MSKEQSQPSREALIALREALIALTDEEIEKFVDEWYFEADEQGKAKLDRVARTLLASASESGAEGRDALERVAAQMRKGGARLPVDNQTMSPTESGLSIGLLLVEQEIAALAAQNGGGWSRVRVEPLEANENAPKGSTKGTP